MNGPTNASPAPKPDPKKRYPCSHNCGRYFRCLHNVKQHIREKHTFDRPYRCHLCPNKAYARPWCLNRHMDSIHGIKIGHGRARRASMVADDKESANETNAGEPMITTRSAVPEVSGLAGANNETSSQNITSPFDSTSTAALGRANNQLTAFEESVSPVDDDLLRLRSDSVMSQVFGCMQCIATFESRDTVCAHYHTAHGLPLAKQCPCHICQQAFSSNLTAPTVPALVGQSIAVAPLVAPSDPTPQQTTGALDWMSFAPTAPTNTFNDDDAYMRKVFEDFAAIIPSFPQAGAQGVVDHGMMSSFEPSADYSAGNSNGDAFMGNPDVDDFEGL